MNEATDKAGPSRAEAGERAWILMIHDMRNALSGMVGNLSLIDPAPLSPADRGRLEGVSLSAGLLVGLVEAAGRLARPDTPASAPETIELASLLDTLERTWRPLAARKGLTLSAETAPETPPVLVADRLRLDRVLGNLIGNALKFTGTGGVTITARGAPGRRLVVEVADTGPGLDEAALRRLFQPFAPGAALPGHGEGLGLHIAKTEAEALGGSLSVVNRPVGGCLATLDLPTGPVAAVPPPAARAPEPPPHRPALAGLSILLAEDNVTNQLVASQMLESLGARVTVASDGAEALDLFRRQPFDIGLIDIEMPRVSGIDVIRTIRAMPDASSGTTLIALTAYAMREHRDRIAAAGADGLIAKPILGIREFGAEILALHGRGAVPRDRDPVGSAAVEAGIFRTLAETIGPDAMAELLEKIDTDLADVADGLGDGLRRGDAALIRARSHVLISVAGAIGATRLQRMAEELNRSAGEGMPADIPSMVQRIEAGIAGLRAFMRRERETALRNG